MKHRNIKIVLGLLFVLFAWFQRNDPDPILWGLIYIAVAFMCFVNAFNKLPKVLYYISIAGLTIYLIALLPELINWISMGMPSIVSEMKAEEPHIEYTREFGGLLISIFSVLYLWKKNAN